MQKYQEIKSVIDDAKTIALFGHSNIDGDAVGSVAALENVFSQLRKKVFCFSGDPLPQNTDFL